MNKNTIKIVLLVLSAVIFSFGTAAAQKGQGKGKLEKVEKKKDHKGHDHDKAKGHNHDEHKGHDHGKAKGHDHDHKGHNHNDHKGHDHDKAKGHDHNNHKGHDHSKGNHDNHKGHDHQAIDKVQKAEVTAKKSEATITLYKNKIKDAKIRLEAEKKANPNAKDLAEKEERIKIAEKKLAEMELELNKSRMIIELGKDGQIPD